MSSEITRDEVWDYLVSSIRLMLWFTWEHTTKNPSETFEKVITKRVDIWRKTSLNPEHLDGARNVAKSREWLVLVQELNKLFTDSLKNGGCKAFEETAINYLMPFITPRIERDLADIAARKDLERYTCGSLRYDKALLNNNPATIDFHIANASYPESIFKDPAYLPGCFLVMLRQIESIYPTLEIISTCTWLNSQERWLELFPAEWSENMGAEDTNILDHYGFWGQFITSRKTFNHKLGAKFRETGRMPYYPRHSWCHIESMRKHIVLKLKQCL